ncbi:MAG: hypothetical protein ABIN83_00950 [Sphingomicrobium sp.]
MATTKKTTTRRAPRARTTTSASKPTASVARRAGKAISDRPVATAAVATGLVAGIAAAVAGFFAFKKSGKSFSEFSGDIATTVKDKASETSERVKDGLADATTIAKEQVAKLRDGVDTPKSQAEIAEEALTLKETGKTVDPLIEQQTKVGAASY